MPFTRGNARGPAEMRAGSAIYFHTLRNRGKMRAGEKLTREEICGESEFPQYIFLPMRFSAGPRVFPRENGLGTPSLQ